MSSALETFRAQRQIAEQVHEKVTEIEMRLGAIVQQMNAVTQDRELRRLLSEEQAWLTRAEDLIREVRGYREMEQRRFWPWVWQRWAIVLALSATTAFGGTAGYVLATRPQADEIEQLRGHTAWAMSLAERVMKMTPAQRRQFDALMK